ncbi:MAG: V-type ATP synthase subunit E [Candidatus Hydrogenedens sp.]
MALDEISKAVLDSVQREAELIIKSAMKEAEEKKKNAQRSAEEKAERLYQLAIRNIDEEMARKSVQVQGQINKEVLKEKNIIITQVFQKARELVLKSSAQEYQQLMEKLLTRAIPQGSKGTIRVHKDDLELFKSLVNKWNTSHGTVLTIDDKTFLPSRGGFLFITDGYQVDQTLDTILSDLQREIVPIVAQNLFIGNT